MATMDVEDNGLPEGMGVDVGEGTYAGVKLTRAELTIVQLIAVRRATVRELAVAMHGYDDPSGRGNVRTVVSRLRRKLAGVATIEGRHAFGYRLEAAQ